MKNQKKIFIMKKTFSTKNISIIKTLNYLKSWIFLNKKICFFIFIWISLLGSYVYITFFLSFSLPIFPSSIIYLDRDGQEIGEKIYSWSIRHREISLKEIPNFYQKSLISLEDTSFWTNNGISISWIIRSIFHNIQAGKIIEWGTTISSGLIRNIFWIDKERTIQRKCMEFVYAIRINHLFTKEN